MLPVLPIIRRVSTPSPVLFFVSVPPPIRVFLISRVSVVGLSVPPRLVASPVPSPAAVPRSIAALRLAAVPSTLRSLVVPAPIGVSTAVSPV